MTMHRKRQPAFSRLRGAAVGAAIATGIGYLLVVAFDEGCNTYYGIPIDFAQTGVLQVFHDLSDSIIAWQSLLRGPSPLERLVVLEPFRCKQVPRTTPVVCADGNPKLIDAITIAKLENQRR